MPVFFKPVFGFFLFFCSFPSQTAEEPFSRSASMVGVKTPARRLPHSGKAEGANWPTFTKFAIFFIAFLRFGLYIIVGLCVVFPFGEDAFCEDM